MQGNADIDITDICIDSRKVSKGAAFIAVKGTVADGHQFIGKAIEDGAIAIICEVLPDKTREGIVYVQVENSAAATAQLRISFDGLPSQN